MSDVEFSVSLHKSSEAQSLKNALQGMLNRPDINATMSTLAARFSEIELDALDKNYSRMIQIQGSMQAFTDPTEFDGNVLNFMNGIMQAVAFTQQKPAEGQRHFIKNSMLREQFAAYASDMLDIIRQSPESDVKTMILRQAKDVLSEDFGSFEVCKDQKTALVHTLYGILGTHIDVMKQVIEPLRNNHYQYGYALDNLMDHFARHKLFDEAHAEAADSDVEDKEDKKARVFDDMTNADIVRDVSALCALTRDKEVGQVAKQTLQPLTQALAQAVAAAKQTPMAPDMRSLVKQLEHQLPRVSLEGISHG